jgi:hypothetical protein
MGAVIPQEHFRITKGSPKMFARKTSPSKTMECWFCPDCGTRLYHVPGGATYPNRNIKPGTLDDTSWLIPTTHFWTRNAGLCCVSLGSPRRPETRYQGGTFPRRLERMLLARQRSRRQPAPRRTTSFKHLAGMRQRPPPAALWAR